MSTFCTFISVYVHRSQVGVIWCLSQDQFFDYMIQQAIKLDQKVLLDNRSKFVLVHASSGFKHSLKGIVQCFVLRKIQVECLFQLIVFLSFQYKIIMSEEWKVGKNDCSTFMCDFVLIPAIIIFLSYTYLVCQLFNL